SSSTKVFANVFMPSSTQGWACSLEANSPWKYWWPNSWIVVNTPVMRSSYPSDASPGGSPKIGDVVYSVGYSIPCAPAASGGGCTMVIVLHGTGPNNSDR